MLPPTRSSATTTTTWWVRYPSAWSCRWPAWPWAWCTTADPDGVGKARLRRAFPSADLVVYGHSHIPWDAPGLDGQRLLNPGSPTQRRSQPHPTIAVVDLADGRIRHREIVVV